MVEVCCDAPNANLDHRGWLKRSRKVYRKRRLSSETVVSTQEALDGNLDKHRSRIHERNVCPETLMTASFNIDESKTKSCGRGGHHILSSSCVT